MTLCRPRLFNELYSSSTDNLSFFLVGYYHEVFEVSSLYVSEMLSKEFGALWKPFLQYITEWIDCTVAQFLVKPFTPVENSWVLHTVVVLACYQRSYTINELYEQLISISATK